MGDDRKRTGSPQPGRWYFDCNTGEVVTPVSESDEEMWWETKGGTVFYCDPLDWYMWGRFL